MTKSNLIGATALSLSFAQAFIPQMVMAQTAAAPKVEEIIVTAQRKSQLLQDVPISVSAVSGAQLDRQQIRTSSDLQLSLPNITLTKTNFTTASFTIRGIGDLCTGTTCDNATAIHINEMPLLQTRFFESEFYDLERIEILRGPQGTLFGRNATSGVVDFITAKPKLDKFGASAEAEYGNFNSVKVKGMLNVPLTETLGVRLAGYYLHRDGETLNLFDNSKIDGRKQYSVRGSIRWKPTSDTTVDVMGSYFREKDNRLRIQKQLCHRDPTGILGCLPDKTAAETVNGNSQFENLLTSREFLAVATGSAANPAGLNFLGLGSIYGKDVFSNSVNPADARTVNTAFTPTYLTDELQLMGHIEHDFGKAKLTLIGGYQRSKVDSEEDGDLAVANSYAGNPGILGFLAAGAGLTSLPALGLSTAAQALFPNANLATGTVGNVCTSAAEGSFTGVFGGHTQGCSPTGLKFDRSTIYNSQFSLEGHLNTDFDGPINFLIGGIYVDAKSKQNEYYLNAFQVDYLSAVLGYAKQLGGLAAGLPITQSGYLASPYFDNDESSYSLKSYGIFGEAYYKLSDKLKLTLGARYAHDTKTLIARTTLVSSYVNYGSTDGTKTSLPDGLANALGVATVPFSTDSASLGRLTGRAVLDYKVDNNHLLYLSYSRGSKSGGINPPLSPIYAVPKTFKPETINAFEVGSKNSFMDGALHLNLSAFYYDYKNLQLAQIVARTAVNNNINAKVYGLEAESIIRPTPEWQFNINASYLKSKISGDQFIVNPQDPSGGDGDAVIIKDITNGSNCTVTSPLGAATTAGFVGQVNAGLGLKPTQAIPTLPNQGAFSVCNVLIAVASGINPKTGGPSGTGVLPFIINQGGIPVNVRGNQIPQAPQYKVSVGGQYTADLGNGMTLTPRADLAFTGEYFATVYNKPIDKVPSYTIINLQMQLNGKDDRWFVRGFVQNLTNNSATTGQYVTDQSQGLFTNAFTLEPRRFGVAVGAKF